MVDSWGKSQDGVIWALKGYSEIYGSYEECVDIKVIPTKTENVSFSGQYCTLFYL